jgi:hypothetical protein
MRKHLIVPLPAVLCCLVRLRPKLFKKILSPKVPHFLMDLITLKEEHADFGVCHYAVLLSASLSLGPDAPLSLFFGHLL